MAKRMKTNCEMIATMTKNRAKDCEMVRARWRRRNPPRTAAAMTASNDTATNKHPKAKCNKEQENWREDDGACTRLKELAQTFDHVHAGLQPAVERARCRDRNQRYKDKNRELHDERLSCRTNQAGCLPAGCRSRLILEVLVDFSENCKMNSHGGKSSYFRIMARCASLPPNQTLGIARTTSATGYHFGPGSGLCFRLPRVRNRPS